MSTQGVGRISAHLITPGVFFEGGHHSAIFSRYSLNDEMNPPELMLMVEISRNLILVTFRIYWSAQDLEYPHAVAT